MKKIKIFLSFLFNEDKLYGLYATSKSNNNMKISFLSKTLKAIEERLSFLLFRMLFNRLPLGKLKPISNKG